LLGSSNAGISAKASAAAVHGDSKQQATKQSDSIQACPRQLQHPFGSSKHAARMLAATCRH
jgi:hypothetical protein